MHLSEASITPYQSSPVPPARAVLVFAPHPDDEIFGCAGALALHAGAGHPVHVVLLTAGDHQGAAQGPADYADTRLKESAQAARILGIAPPQCWGLADRGVQYGEDLVQRMLGAIAQAQANVIYAPSPWELHPDHRATCMGALEAVRRLGEGVTLCLYEVSAPLRPNRLVDISPVWDVKQAAMQAFGSQEQQLPYASFIGALNRFRALTLHPAAEQAEAFECLTAEQLRGGQRLLIEGEREQLLARGVTVLPQDAPLVSVIVRTMGRPTLAQALASVALQTYAHIEIVLVDAAGEGLPGVEVKGMPATCRMVNTGRRLSRADAANAGLQAAQGEYCIFLDDDDWFYPDHIAKLVLALRQTPLFKAAHTAVECVDESGQLLGKVFDFPYATGELRYGNFLPIHSVLFQRTLIDAGCAFDRAFDLYEDWDFWLQVEAQTPFTFVPGISAAYRIGAGAGEGVQAEAQRSRQATAQLYDKWQVFQSSDVFAELIGRAVSRRQLMSDLERAGQARQRLAHSLEAEQQQALASQQQAEQARQDAHQMRLAHDQACAARDQFQREAEQARQDAHQMRLAHDQACAARDQFQREAEQARQDAHQMRLAHDQACATRDQACAARDRLQHEAEQARQDAHQTRLAHERFQQEAEQARHGLQRRVDDLEQALQLTHTHAHNLQAALDATRQSLDATRHDMTVLQASRSWRWTLPMRQAVRNARNTRSLLAAARIAQARGMNWGQLTGRAAQVYRQEGMSGVRQRVKRLLQKDGAGGLPAQVLDGEGGPPGATPQPRGYGDWAVAHDTLDETQLQLLARQYQRLSSRPLLSIIMPVYNPQDADVLRAIASVRAQIYPHWELCICDDASPGEHTRDLLRQQAQQEPRIRLAFHERNQHISAASNSAIAMAQGQYIAFLDQDDELRPHALLSVAQALEQRPDARVLYSDEDKIDAQGATRFDPYFKPDFNLGLLRSHNYMCHFAVYDSALVRQLGGLRVGFEGAQDYDFVLRAVDAIDRHAIVHIPRVLYHWRTAVGSTASGHGNKSYAFKAGQRALREHLQRRGLKGDIAEAAEAPGMYRVLWQRPAPAPLVSIVIPTRNGHDILLQCLDSLRQTAYPNYEVIVIDNGSDDPRTLELLAARSQQGQIRVQRDDGPFNFSAINNRGVRQAARGEFVLLMNNDIEITHPEWLDEMVGPAMEPGVGCVGARLWYPDGRLQHAGVILVCGVAGHAHKFLGRGQHGYMGRAVLAQDFVAVTAACLLVRRSIYEEVGGLDEMLAVAFNDVDFCLKVHQAGYRNHWTPHAQLIHHESVTRGYEDTPEKQLRFKGEIDVLQSRWSALIAHDPCYSPNLTADAEDFSLAWPPRATLEHLRVA